MNEEQSIVKKTESALDDLLDLWRRRKLVCSIVLTIIIFPASFTLYQQFVAVPKLKSQVSTLGVQKHEAEQKRDKAELQLAPFLATAERRFLTSQLIRDLISFSPNSTKQSTTCRMPLGRFPQNAPSTQL